MALSDFVQVNISATSPSVTRPGFGTPMFLAGDCPAGFTERVRTYTEASQLLTDGWSTSDGTYRAVSRMCQQSPRPPQFKVGRLALKPTQAWTLTPVAVNSTNYTLEIDGVSHTVTSDSSATATEICDALRTAFGTPADLTLGGTSTLTILAGTAGKFHTVKSGDVRLLGVAQNHADPGVATDLAAIALENSDWYALHNQFNSRLMAVAIAGWAETNKKLFVGQTQDSAIVQVAGGSAADVASDCATAGYFYTALMYSESTEAFADAAWMGSVLPWDPGSEQWALWTLVGPAASVLTETQYLNAIASQRHCNVYLANIAGKSITDEGKVSSGEWIDVVRFKDWLATNMALDLFQALQSVVQSGKKTPYTDAGIASLQGVALARLKLGVKAGGLSENPAPAVQVPKAADVSGTDKSNRVLTGMTFTATLAGAIKAVKPVTGTISL